jgi:hypothetical protein
MNSDESVIEITVHMISETSSDIKNSRKCMNEKANKKDSKYQDSYIKFELNYDVEKGKPKCVICLEPSCPKLGRSTHLNLSVNILCIFIRASNHNDFLWLMVLVHLLFYWVLKND